MAQRTADLNARPEVLQLRTRAESLNRGRSNRTGLPDRLKGGLETLSGLSMDHVAVHYNSAEPARLSAHAFARGSDIHVGPGQERHLPHEAWHVVQQAQGRVRATEQFAGAPVNLDPGLEAEAERMGEMALRAEGDPERDLAPPPAAPPSPPVQGYFIFQTMQAGTFSLNGWMVDEDDEEGAPYPVAVWKPDRTEALIDTPEGRIHVIRCGDPQRFRRADEPDVDAPVEMNGPSAEADMGGDSDSEAEPPVFQQGEAANYLNPTAKEGKKGISATSTFTVQAVLVPMETGKASADTDRDDVTYTIDQLFVASMLVGNDDRPDTRFGTAQERHTVAWTLIRAANQAAVGRTLIEVFERYVSDMAALAAQKQPERTRALINMFLIGAKPLFEANARMPIDRWQALLCRVVELYTQAYQASSAATFAHGAAKYRGEATWMARLTEAEQGLERGDSVESDGLGEAAEGLLDVNLGLSLGYEGAVEAVRHWRDMLRQVFPRVWDAFGAEVTDPILTEKQTPAFQKRIGVATYGEALDQARETMGPRRAGVQLASGGNAVSEAIEVPDALASDFVANVSTSPLRAKGESTLQVQREGGDKTSAVQVPTYTPENVRIDRVRVSDRDRPQTRFEKQMSHTVAWTLLRAEMHACAGLTAAQAIDHLGPRLVSALIELKQSSGKGLAAADVALASAGQLAQSRGAALPIHEWQALLSDAFRRAAIVYHQLSSASYVTTEGHGQAFGHAEGSHMEMLRRNEHNLGEARALCNPPEAVARAAIALLDAEISLTLSPEDYLSAVGHWLNALEGAFPLIYGSGRDAIVAALGLTPQAQAAIKSIGLASAKALADAAEGRIAITRDAFGNLRRVHRPAKAGQPHDLLVQLGVGHVPMPGTGNDCAIASILHQLGLNAVPVGDPVQFATFVRQRANLAFGSMIDVLNNGNALLQAVQDWFASRGQASPGRLVLRVTTGTDDGSLIPFENVAAAGAGADIFLDLYYNGTDHFDSLSNTGNLY